MTTGGEPDEGRPERTGEPEWQRRRRLAEVFGDALPEQTSDDRDADRSSAPSGKGDAWYRDQVPPHHG